MTQSVTTTAGRTFGLRSDTRKISEATLPFNCYEWMDSQQYLPC